MAGGTATATKATTKTSMKSQAKAPVKVDKRSTSGPAKRAEALRLKREAAAQEASHKKGRGKAAKPEARTNRMQKDAVKAPAKLEVPAWEVLRRAADLYKQIGDPTRLALIHMLRSGEKNVGALCAALEQSQPAVSHHLALLKANGIVTPRRDGKHNFYRLSNTTLGGVIANLDALAGTHRTS